MKILICGDRNWTNVDVIRRVFDSHVPPNAVVIHGDNGYDARGRPLWGEPDELAVRGADKLAGRVARARGHRVESFTPNWATYGRSAGPIRNQRMLDARPDFVIAFHNDLANSRGTHDMIGRAQNAGVRVLHAYVRSDDTIGVDTYNARMCHHSGRDLT